jgi:hypothetical protein
MLDLRAQLVLRARQEQRALQALRDLLARRAQQDPREILVQLEQRVLQALRETPEQLDPLALKA